MPGRIKWNCHWKFQRWKLKIKQWQQVNFGWILGKKNAKKNAFKRKQLINNWLYHGFFLVIFRLPPLWHWSLLSHSIYNEINVYVWTENSKRYIKKVENEKKTKKKNWSEQPKIKFLEISAKSKWEPMHGWQWTLE